MHQDRLSQPKARMMWTCSGMDGQPLRAADDVRDFHHVVIHHRGQVIGRQAIRFEQDGIIEGGVFGGDGTAQQVVVVIEPSFGILKRITYFSPRRPGGEPPRDQDCGRCHHSADFACSSSAPGGLCPAARGAETGKGMPSSTSFQAYVLVDLAPLGLAVGTIRTADIRAFVIVDAQPVQAVDQFLFRARDSSVSGRYLRCAG